MNGTIDGFIVDLETGEIIDVVHPEKESVNIDSAEMAEWVMRKLIDVDAELAGLDARKKAIMENFERMEAPLRGRKAFLTYRFNDQLVAYAKAQLDGTSRRTWACPYGTVAFRTVPAKQVIVDHDQALAWAAENCPDAIKRTLLISKIPLLGIEEAHHAGVEFVPSHESVIVKTGVKNEND